MLDSFKAKPLISSHFISLCVQVSSDTSEREELELRAELARVTLENEQLLANLSHQRVRSRAQRGAGAPQCWPARG